jgi:purine-nucleoside phosphorylase
VPTPHISADPGAFAETILLPGDPLRAKHIAETYLDDVEEVTAVRNMLGFTGSYRGTPLSVMGTGMGIPSASIYATELVREYGIKNLIRVGTCGAVRADVDVRDVLIATGASTDSGVNRRRFGGRDFAAVADFGLARTAAEAAERLEIPVRLGSVFSSDLFYGPEDDLLESLQRMGILAVEMEAAGLYGIAAEEGVAALAICTVSDHIVTHEETTSAERQTAFTQMMEIALEAAIAV